VVSSNYSREEPTPSGNLISIVDDDHSVREALKALLRAHGLSAAAFPSGVEFLGSPSIDETACLIADVNMPVLTGIELFERLKEIGHPIPTILITGRPDEAVRARAMRAGVACYLLKPLTESELIACLSSAIRPGLCTFTPKLPPLPLSD
jgi:FixJ family two-component response regulator